MFSEYNKSIRSKINMEFASIMLTIIGLGIAVFTLVIGLERSMEEKATIQAQRSDRLYQNFIDLQKTVHEDIKEMHGNVCIIKDRNKEV